MKTKTGIAICAGVYVLACIWSLAVTSDARKTKESLKPEVFVKWKLKKILSPQRVLVLVVENPEAASTIRKAAISVRPTSMKLVGYRYFDGGIPKMFVYDDTEEKFVETKLTTEQKKQCLRCHRDGEYTGGVSSGDAG